MKFDQAGVFVTFEESPKDIRQNMKSMETYYRWLAIQYAAQCGRIHSELVETLFRYNARSRMGRFVARLETFCGRAPGAGDSPPREGVEET